MPAFEVKLTTKTGRYKCGVIAANHAEAQRTATAAAPSSFGRITGIVSQGVGK